MSGANIQLRVAPPFIEMLAHYKLRLIWTPPTCSWRLVPPACGGPPSTEVALVTIPIVGGTIAHWRAQPLLRGRLELGGRLEIAGTQSTLLLRDMTINPGTSILRASTVDTRTDAFFLDGTVATIAESDGGIKMTGVEVRVHRTLTAHIRADLGVPAMAELVKVGDLAMNVSTKGRR